MVRLVKDLWAGEVPLGRAFWRYAIGYGLLLNLASHGLLLILVSNEAGLAAIALAFALPLPYNLLVVVAVWRSAGRYAGSRTWAEAARVAALVWMVVLTAA